AQSDGVDGSGGMPAHSLHGIRGSDGSRDCFEAAGCRDFRRSHRLHLPNKRHHLAHPCFARKSSNRASSQVSMPSSCAVASLDPAASPATTRCVFFDTLPETFAPRASSFAPASSRLIEASPPVSTTV